MLCRLVLHVACDCRTASYDAANDVSHDFVSEDCHRLQKRRQHYSVIVSVADQINLVAKYILNVDALTYNPPDLVTLILQTTSLLAQLNEQISQSNELHFFGLLDI